MDMSDYGVPDDEPLSPAEMAEALAQSTRSRAVLSARAAGARMTPMEYIAAGRATANVPTEAELSEARRRSRFANERGLPEALPDPEQLAREAERLVEPEERKRLADRLADRYSRESP